MVCVPCIILPVVLAVYLKFIQPFILRFLPDRWRAWFDRVLYPTCPVGSFQQQNVNASCPIVNNSEEVTTLDSKKDKDEKDKDE